MRDLFLFLVVLTLGLSLASGGLLAQAAESSAMPANDGSVILRMCKGADRVKALSVMCHSYLNGYIDAAHHYGKGRPAFCLAGGDKEKAPGTLVAWIDAHPETLKQPAGAVLQQALTAKFPCGKK
jgi:hypothetical protein